jgi:molybdopterin-guanine dinucleotide biosynthesis protein A
VPDDAGPPAGFVVAVLTGGASRRMGQDKATLVVDGAAMAVRVARASTAAGAAAVVCVGAPVDGLDRLPDDHPGSGPLGGVVTALRWAGDRPVVVLACDLLDPDPDAVRAAVEALATDSGCDVAVPVVAGREQWLHACWRPSALGPIEDAFGAGERAVHRAAAALQVCRYDAADPHAHADADTVEDLRPDDR